MHLFGQNSILTTSRKTTKHTFSVNEKDPAELLAFLVAIIFASKSTETTHTHTHTSILTTTVQMWSGGVMVRVVDL